MASISSIDPPTMDNVYLQKPPPATIIYAFIGGDPNTQMAKSSRRYNEDLARVNDINFRESRSDSSANSLDTPIIEEPRSYSTSFKRANQLIIPPSPAVGKH